MSSVTAAATPNPTSSNCTDVTRRIVAWMMLALLSVGGVLGLLQYWHTVDLETAEAHQRARCACVTLQGMYSSGSTDKKRTARLQAAVSSFVTLNPISSIMVLDDRGRVLAGSEPGKIGRRALSSSSGRLAMTIHRVVNSGDPIFLPAGSSTRTRDYLVAPAAVGGKPTSRGVIVIALDLETMYRTALYGACQAVVLVVGEILVMWLVAATLLRRWVLHPLRRLADATLASQSTGRFQLPEKLPHNEVGALGAAFENVFHSLADSQKQARKLALIAARTSNAVVLTDVQGRVEWVNEAFTTMTEFTLDEMRGQAPGRLLQGPQTDALTIEQMRAAIGRGEGFAVELANCSPSGRAYWVHVEVQPIRDEQGQLTNFMALASDITSRRRAEQELKSYAVRLESTNATLQKYIVAAEAATQAKSEFLANMSHEIRTPMTAILGYADLILEQEGPQADSARAEALRTIRRNGEYLLEIINDILDLSKIEAGRLEVERIACHPVELARDVIQLMQLRAESKGLSLSLRFEGPVPATIQSDPTRIRQILINLVGNAIKFTEAGGVRLVVRGLRDGDGPGRHRLQFDVHDTGIGMTPEQMTQLFQPFNQADTSTTRRFGGTGLGLSISKRLAEMLRGAITVESAAGEGSRFRLEIEALVDESTERKPPLEAMPVSCTGGLVSPRGSRHKVRLLVAEDAIDTQRLLVHVLRAAGADVVLAGNGRVAVEKALAARDAGRPFDVILMDMQMPELDGYDATVRLRQEGYTLPIIALTAHAMNADRKRCLDAGCDDFATKPIERQKLVSLVAQYCGRPTPPMQPATT